MTYPTLNFFGDKYRFFVSADGRCFATGNNNHGQLGVGNTTNQQDLTAVVGLPANSRVIAIAGGKDYTIVSLADGRCFVTGNNQQGQLGVGNANDQHRFTPVMGLPDNAWVVAIACGLSHTVVSLADGRCFATGNNNHGQLGVGDTDNRQSFSPVRGLPGESRVLAIACGEHHTVLSLANGHCFVTGHNNQGQLGLGDQTNQLSFFQARNLPTTTWVVAIACHNNHTFVSLADGRCFATGNNYSGHLGVGNEDEQHRFTPVMGLPDNAWVVAITCGRSHTFVSLSDGRCFAAGHNNHGQLGVGDTDNRHSFTPVQDLTDNPRVMAIACGRFHTIVSLADGRCLASGHNRYGSLGVGDIDDRHSFTPVQGLTDNPWGVATIACEDFCSVLTLADGRSFVAGDNQADQLGAERPLVNTFTQVATRLASVAATPSATISLKSIALRAFMRPFNNFESIFQLPEQNALPDHILKQALRLYLPDRLGCPTHKIFIKPILGRFIDKNGYGIIYYCCPLCSLDSRRLTAIDMGFCTIS